MPADLQGPAKPGQGHLAEAIKGALVGLRV